MYVIPPANSEGAAGPARYSRVLNSQDPCQTKKDPDFYIHVSAAEFHLSPHLR